MEDKFYKRISYAAKTGKTLSIATDHNTKYVAHKNRIGFANVIRISKNKG